MGNEQNTEQGGDRTRRQVVARGLPYFAVYVDIVRHPKTQDLEAIVGAGPAALGYIVALWSFAAEFYGDGRIPNRPGVVAAFERMARWTGEPGGLIAALASARFLTCTSRALVVHKWREYQSPHVARRERERDKKRRKRAKDRGSCPGDGPGDVDGTWRLDPDREVERDRDSETASHPDPRSSTAEPTAAGWPDVSPEIGDDPGLSRFRAELAARLGMPAIGVGKDRSAVLEEFAKHIRARGREEVLACCVEAAGLIKRNGHGMPANLAAFPNWLNTLETPSQPTRDLRVGSAPAQSHEVFRAGGGGVKPFTDEDAKPRKPTCTAPAEKHTHAGRIEL